jgi:hypothetical protein
MVLMRIDIYLYSTGKACSLRWDYSFMNSIIIGRIHSMYWNCINYWVNNWISTHETTYGGYDATGTHLPYPYEAGSAATGSNPTTLHIPTHTLHNRQRTQGA